MSKSVHESRNRGLLRAYDFWGMRGARRGCRERGLSSGPQAVQTRDLEAVVAAIGPGKTGDKNAGDAGDEGLIVPGRGAGLRGRAGGFCVAGRRGTWSQPR